MTMKKETAQLKSGFKSSTRTVVAFAALGFSVLTDPVITTKSLGTATAMAKTDAGAPKDKAPAPKNPLNQDLLEAIGNGDKSAVEKLLGQGADPNAKDSAGKPLLVLAVVDDHVEIAKALLKKGADVNVTDDKGRTPLIEAAFWGHLGAVRLLLDNGAAVDATDKSDRTALFYARENGSSEIVKALETAKGAKA